MVLLPTASILAFKFDLGLKGLCIGGLMGIYVIMLSYLAICLYTDWQ